MKYSTLIIHLLCCLVIQIVRCFPIITTGGSNLRTAPQLSLTIQEWADPSNNVTIRYSHSFRRHILEKNGVVIQSYMWLDQALQQYPRAKLLPVNPIAMIAGTSVFDIFEYPLNTEVMNVSENKQNIVDILQETLMWLPTMANNLLEQWPELQYYPADELRERIQFFMAPLPEPDLLHKVNFTENIDWPVQLFRHGRGGGMSLSQISHALHVIPQFVLRLPQVPSAQIADQAIIKLYEQTPSVVVAMTNDRMEAWLVGASATEVIALAHLHWMGWQWIHCKLLLHAFPGILQPTLYPSWDIRGRVRSQLRPDVLHYLQGRLQLRPWHLQAMFRTHSSLTGYDLAMVQRNMDYLQRILELQSAQLRQILLEMPSLLGVSTGTLQQRINFWRFDVGLSVSQLRSCSLEKPAILQYSLDGNLKPKLPFFRKDLNISAEDLVTLTVKQPVMWAYSLEKNLIPSAQAFVDYCGEITLADYGILVTRAPQLLRSNWKTNLSFKLQFLRDTLALSDHELCVILFTSPHILSQSLKTLELKMTILEGKGGPDGRLAIKKNPSLLLSSPERLEKRMHRCLERTTSEVTLLELLTGTEQKKASSVGKRVYLLKEGSSEIDIEFQGVAAAASYAGLSQARMYRILQEGLLSQGRQFVYAKPTELSSSTIEATQNNTDHRHGLLPILESDPHSMRLCVEVAGYAYPPGSSVRGRRRSGGMALRVSTWSIKEWRKYCSAIWKGRKFRLLDDQTTVILGYHYVRPSRPRCSLFACYEALRLARLWLSDMRTQSADIEIKTDSIYAVDLLQNTTRLLEWGEAERYEDCHFTGLPVDSAYKANPDILHSIARSYYYLNRQEDRPETERMQVTVHFTFSHPSSKDGTHTRNGAKLAATLMYDATRA